MTLAPFVTSDSLKVIPSTNNFPAKENHQETTRRFQGSSHSISISKKRKDISKKKRERLWVPLKMSFWPRGRTLVRGCRRDLTSLIVESRETEIGMDLPLNFTVMFIAVSWPSTSIFFCFLSVLDDDLCDSFSLFWRIWEGRKRDRLQRRSLCLPCILMQKLWNDAFICENNSCPYD